MQDWVLFNRWASSANAVSPGSNEVMVETAVFRLSGVTRRYGDLVALEDVSLDVGVNEYVSFLGPSGSGKTTLLRVIAGFEAPDAGRVFFEGRDITHLPAHERGVGFVFQNFALFPHLTVLKNVGFGLTYGKSPLPAAEVDRRSREVIEMVGLAGLEDRGVDQISGGQRQRVALARTLAMQPKLVLLDEPLGALDANLRGRMRNELRAIRERLGVTFLHVTGSETEALAMGGQFGTVSAASARKSDRDVYAVRYDRMRVQPMSARADGPALKATFVASEYLGSSIMNFFEAEDGKVIEMEHHLSLGAPDTYEPKQDYLLTWNPEQAIVFGREAR